MKVTSEQSKKDMERVIDNYKLVGAGIEEEKAH